VRDYMNKADAKKSVTSSTGLLPKFNQNASPQRSRSPVGSRSKDYDDGDELPRFAVSTENSDGAFQYLD